MNSSIEFFNGIRRNRIEDIRSFLANGGNINTRDENGMTALSVAVDNGNAEMVEYLLRSGAKPDITDKWGQTALMLAAGRNDAANAKLLIEAGARTDPIAANGLTARQYAIENGGKDVEAVLVSYKKKSSTRRQACRH